MSASDVEQRGRSTIPRGQSRQDVAPLGLYSPGSHARHYALGQYRTLRSTRLGAKHAEYNAVL
eukprot:3719793-Rhodomonas_salina.6